MKDVFKILLVLCVIGIGIVLSARYYQKGGILQFQKDVQQVFLSENDLRENVGGVLETIERNRPVIDQLTEEIQNNLDQSTHFYAKEIQELNSVSALPEVLELSGSGELRREIIAYGQDIFKVLRQEYGLFSDNLFQSNGKIGQKEKAIRSFLLKTQEQIKDAPWPLLDQIVNDQEQYFKNLQINSNRLRENNEIFWGGIREMADALPAEISDPVLLFIREIARESSATQSYDAAFWELEQNMIARYQDNVLAIVSLLGTVCPMDCFYYTQAGKFNQKDSGTEILYLDDVMTKMQSSFFDLLDRLESGI